MISVVIKFIFQEVIKIDMSETYFYSTFLLHILLITCPKQLVISIAMATIAGATNNSENPNPMDSDVLSLFLIDLFLLINCERFFPLIDINGLIFLSKSSTTILYTSLSLIALPSRKCQVFFINRFTHLHIKCTGRTSEKT